MELHEPVIGAYYTGGKSMSVPPTWRACMAHADRLIREARGSELEDRGTLLQEAAVWLLKAFTITQQDLHLQPEQPPLLH
jgi:hypothetical protein